MRWIAFLIICLATAVRADDWPSAVDLSGFAAIGPAGGADLGIGVDVPSRGILVTPADLARGSGGSAPPRWADNDDDWERSPHRFYIAGLLGASFATLEVAEPPAIVDSLLTAGAAAGVALERPGGWLRIEFEGRGRDPITETRTDPAFVGGITATAFGGWSALANVWRDIEITDRFGCYLGGGVGAGGYTMLFDGTVSDATFPLVAQVSGRTGLTGLAWQTGAGITWALGDRTTLDLGYRYFAVDGGPADVTVALPPFGSFTDLVGTRFGASELMFTIRVYEPFRDWRD